MKTLEALNRLRGIETSIAAVVASNPTMPEVVDIETRLLLFMADLRQDARLDALLEPPRHREHTPRCVGMRQGSPVDAEGDGI